MKHILKIFLTTALFGLLSTAYASLVVIGNPNLKINKLTKNQLAAIYLNQSVKLPTKENLHPFNLTNDSSAYKEFYKQILNWKPSQVSSYWSSQVFSGNGDQSGSAADAQAAIAAVERTPGAIAYVDSSALANAGNKVKILYGHYTPSAIKAKVASTTATTNNPYYHSALSSDSTEANDSGFHSMYQKPARAALRARPNVHNNNDFAVAASQPNHAISPISDSTTPTQNDAVTAPLWNTIRKHLHVGKAWQHRIVAHQLLFYATHHWIVQNMLNNATPYIHYVYQQTKKRHMPAYFALLPMIESGYNPYAYSSAGATGLWQMMPGTASSYGLDIDWWYDQRRDILTSTNAALNYLVRLHNNLGHWYLALAAYNAGQGAVEAAMHYNRRYHRSIDYWALPLPYQTRNYVPKLLALAIMIKHPNRYHIKLPKVGNTPYFVRFKMNSQLDIREVAKLASISTTMVHILNPGIRRYATQPDSTYTLLIPANKAAIFAHNLVRLKTKRHISWQYHEVQKSDTLASIAHNYHTNIAVLKSVNHLKSNYLRPGRGLIVPIWLNKTYQLPLQTKSENNIVKAISPAAIKLKHTVSAIDKTTAATVNAADILSGIHAGYSKNVFNSFLRKNQSTAKISQKQRKIIEPRQAVLIKKKTQAIPTHKKQPAINKDEDLKALIEKIYGST